MESSVELVARNLNATKYDTLPEVLYILTDRQDIREEISSMRKTGCPTTVVWTQMVLVLGFLGVTHPPTGCNNYFENPLPPDCVLRPGFRVKGSVFAHDQWHPKIEFSYRTMSLWNGTDVSQDAIGKCTPTWDQNILCYT